MPLGPYPKDILVDTRNNVTRTWGVWLNNLRNLIDFDEPPSAIKEITATGGIDVTSPLMRIISATAGNVTVTKNPQISPGFDGQEVKLEGNDNVKTVTITDGNGLALAGGASFVSGDTDVINLTYNKTKVLWIEDYRSNN